jgi:hypothetical protein
VIITKARFDSGIQITQSKTLEETMVEEKNQDQTMEEQLHDDVGEVNSRISDDFAFKLVNAVKSMNQGEISYYELVNSFSLADELKCLYLFVKALPYDPIIPIYPETPFLFFKGVPVPRAFDLSDERARDIENFMKGQNSEYYTDLRLHDLDNSYLDAYESAIRIYNDLLDKTRRSYQENVKLAKSQVFEVSAVLVCLFVIIITLVGLT